MVTEPLHNPCGGHLSLDFANSTGRSPGSTRNERLVDYGALVRWCREAGALPAERAGELRATAAARPPAAAAVLNRALTLREALFEIWHADIHGDAPPRDALDTLNGELAKALPHARLEPQSAGFAWGWEWDRDAVDAPLWPIARAAAELLVSPERGLVRECAADSCLWLFLDRSRNHRRRWCEMKSCGNREKVRQHRKRRRGAG